MFKQSTARASDDVIFYLFVGFVDFHLQVVSLLISPVDHTVDLLAQILNTDAKAIVKHALQL